MLLLQIMLVIDLVLLHKNISVEGFLYFISSGPDCPKLYQRRNNDGVIVDLPNYDVRQAIQTSDPQAVMESFKVNIRFILPRVFGYRMCPNCPHCAFTDTPCSTKFGNNFEPWGGIAGMAAANACAVEYQGNNNPHAHGHVHFVSAYQHKSLEEIGMLIKQKLLAPETLYAYQETLHRTCGYIDVPEEQRKADRRNMEKEWANKFRASEHDALSQFPDVVLNDHTDTLWNGKQDSQVAQRDALAYSEQYKREADFVMCRTNSHVHIRDPATGRRRPLPGCISKKALDLFKRISFCI